MQESFTYKGFFFQTRPGYDTQRDRCMVFVEKKEQLTMEHPTTGLRLRDRARYEIRDITKNTLRAYCDVDTWADGSSDASCAEYPIDLVSLSAPISQTQFSKLTDEFFRNSFPDPTR